MRVSFTWNNGPLSGLRGAPHLGAYLRPATDRARRPNFRLHFISHIVNRRCFAHSCFLESLALLVSSRLVEPCNLIFSFFIPAFWTKLCHSVTCPRPTACFRLSEWVLETTGALGSGQLGDAGGVSRFGLYLPFGLIGRGNPALSVVVFELCHYLRCLFIGTLALVEREHLFFVLRSFTSLDFLY
jgi:hypothetical protein